MKSIKKWVRKSPLNGWILFGLTMFITFIAGLFISSIMERRVESRLLFQMGKPIGEFESNNEAWKDNFTREYERWAATKESNFKSKYNGSAVRDSLEEDPMMVVLWAGYAFSREYNQSRGHQNAVADVQNILRTDVPQPATCWTCKSPDVPRLMHEMGIDQFYKSKWADLGPQIKNSVGCLDCHDPKTMDLRISRPALVEAYERQGKDIKQATRQEMRSLVCAQCHVEYYFKDKYYLTFPWDKGLTVENIEEYYDEKGHVDFVHALSKVPVIKAQHPDWEIFQTSVHFKRGLSCADCHMPFRSEGGVKFTDHKAQSPLNNINNSCQVCHRIPEDELRKSVEERQDKVYSLRLRAEESLVRSHLEAKAAWDAGASEAEMKPILKLIRHAQWRWDYVTASVGGAFHAPLESARILGTSIEKSMEARRLLTKVLFTHGVKGDVPLPDLSTKAKAQAFIGLDMKKLNEQKEKFIKEVLPLWNKK